MYYMFLLKKKVYYMLVSTAIQWRWWLHILIYLFLLKYRLKVQAIYISCLGLVYQYIVLDLVDYTTFVPLELASCLHFIHTYLEPFLTKISYRLPFSFLFKIFFFYVSTLFIFIKGESISYRKPFQFNQRNKIFHGINWYRFKITIIFIFLILYINIWIIYSCKYEFMNFLCLLT